MTRSPAAASTGMTFRYRNDQSGSPVQQQHGVPRPADRPRRRPAAARLSVGRTAARSRSPASPQSAPRASAPPASWAARTATSAASLSQEPGRPSMFHMAVHHPLADACPRHGHCYQKPRPRRRQKHRNAACVRPGWSGSRAGGHGEAADLSTTPLTGTACALTVNLPAGLHPHKSA